METWSELGDEDDIMQHLKRAEDTIITHPMSSPKKQTIKKNLIQLIEAILASYELQEKYSTKLTPFCMITIGELIKKKPEYFRMVESTLVRNISANKIKAEDVPYIISIISQLYNLLLLVRYDDIKSNEPLIDTCSNILKFLFSVSLRENLVHMDSETDTVLLLLCFDNIIDSCMKLLKPLKIIEQIGEPKKIIIPPVIETPIKEKKVKSNSCCGCW